MIVMIDYGLGNIKSLMNWFKRGHLEVVLSKDFTIIKEAELLILPGVGAFKYGMKKIEPFRALIEKHVGENKPIIGICLGMQMLFDCSFEGDKTKGLGLLKGDIKAFESKALKIPHMGWQALITKEDNFYTGEYVYFVHSYYLETTEDIVLAWCDYNVKVPSVVQKNNILAFQFHPEKSGDFGEKILEKIKEFKNDYLPSH